jgi:hypothetical protein
MILCDWTNFKTIVNNKNLLVQMVEFDTTYELLAFDGAFQLRCTLYKNEASQEDAVEDFEDNYKDNANQVLAPVTSEGLPYNAINRIPGGYTQYPTGRADNIANGTYGDGDILKLDESNTTKHFQLLHHWYAVGAKAIWKGGNFADVMNATLMCPATTGAVEQAGDFDKYQVAPGANMFIPAEIGQGDWDINLAAKLTNTDILKCTPVPSPGNQGWFDYDKWNNVLTVNEDQEGGYNLFDFDINLFKFGNHLFGGDDRECDFICSDVIGKLLYNSWKIKFELTADTTGVEVGIVMLAFVQKNL